MNLNRIKELRNVAHDAQTKMDLISKRIMQGGLSLDQQTLHLDNFAMNQTRHMLGNEELYKLLKNN
tara:strand:+ start:557 stop:754 length:198 start_codon:yes stop_codon:yes gene_type:complete